MTFGHFMSMTAIVSGFWGSLNSCHCTSQSTNAAALRVSWPKS
ncbi:uncharacterized protein LOC26526867 [Drosophila erecta]|nr:uncharacterized protein LOC26526867 [Drosophila erecta]KQS52438.1 uncharacterized protein Dere_GG27043 [Drosophila erecta]